MNTPPNLAGFLFIIDRKKLKLITMKNKKYNYCIDPNLGLIVDYKRLTIEQINEVLPILARFNRRFKRKQVLKHKTYFYNNYAALRA